MKLLSLVLSAVVMMSIAAPAASRAQPAQIQALTTTPVAIPATLQGQINAAIAACNCFVSVTAFQVDPAASAAEVFASPDVLFGVLDLDVQLPWVGIGEINAGALAARLTPSGQQSLVRKIQAFADPPRGPFKLGQYAWSHPTQPDFCSGETLWLQYFEHTGVLFAFRFDTSHEC